MASSASLAPLVSTSSEFTSRGTLIRHQPQSCHVIASRPDLSPFNMCFILIGLRRDKKNPGYLQSGTDRAMIIFWRFL